MSGTSLDGIDVALLRTDGEALVEPGPSRTFAYSPEERGLLKAALAAAPSLQTRGARPTLLAETEEMITERHARAVQTFLQEIGTSAAEVDVVGFHGQTVLHDPARRLTIQIGDGQALADQIGTDVVWDLRADDVAAGGQGAPLVPAYHRALAFASGLALPAAFLNIGGVANLTLISAEGELCAFDTGPGNALLDDWVREHTGKDFDESGRLAASGRVSPSHLAQLLCHPYFDSPPPKSLDRNAFSSEPLAGLSAADGAATLAEFTIQSIKRGLELSGTVPLRVIVCGGGRRNDLLMSGVAGKVKAEVEPVEAIGFDGDGVEAQAFGYLAVRSLEGLPITYPGTTGAPASLTGGRLSRARRHA